MPAAGRRKRLPSHAERFPPQSSRTVRRYGTGRRPGSEHRLYWRYLTRPEVHHVVQRLRGLLREPVGATRRYVLDPEPPVHRGAVELIRTPHAILVRCEADVLIEADCSRCLAAFAYRAPVSFEELYAQQVDVVSGERLAVEDDDGFRIATDHTIPTLPRPSGNIRRWLQRCSRFAVRTARGCAPNAAPI